TICPIYDFFVLFFRLESNLRKSPTGSEDI
ncbi:hypothetical protein RRG08_062150, partial [Elysia crispata]